jgi:threonine dehydrogenase-like Zn-dependent dehydrogenase
MKAIRYSFSIPNYLAVRAADKLPLPILDSGRIPGLSEIEADPQSLPGPEWLRLKPRLCGVCGSDISMLKNTSSPAMSPFVSFPVVPGHEIVADVAEVGAAAGEIAVGQRVVVNPLISCEMRGLAPCRSCASGQPGLCTSAAEGKLAPGMLLGFCRDLPGGWSEELVAHRSQVFPVPEALSDSTAVLVEPFSVAVHAVLKAPPPPESKVLIVGAGSIGLLVLAALRLLGNRAHVTVLARHPIQEAMARRLGADVVLRGKRAGDAAMQVTGAKRYKPIKGKPVYAGGFDWVFDAVGSARSVDESLRVAGPHGRVVLVGCAGELPRVDFSFVWARELEITGCYVYGKEPSHEGAHTFEVAMRLLAERPDLPLGDLVTHTVPLANWREAMQLSLQRGQHGAIKVVFDCGAAGRWPLAASC